MEKVQRIKKICRNGDFQHISNIFGGKKMFSKIGLGHILGIANTRFCAGNQEKQMMKSQENAKKTVFPAFLAKKKVSRKSVSLIF